MLIIIHPHFGCTARFEMPRARDARHLHKGQEWARENPLAERIVREHNGRDVVYIMEALLAKERGEIVFMLDHDCFRQWRWDEIMELHQSMGPQLAARLVGEVERIKKGLISWFVDNFGEGHLLNINHKNTGLYFRRNFDFPCTTGVVLMGEFLECCVEDVRHSLSVMSFTNVRIDEEKCVA